MSSISSLSNGQPVLCLMISVSPRSGVLSFCSVSCSLCLLCLMISVPVRLMFSVSALSDVFLVFVCSLLWSLCLLCLITLGLLCLVFSMSLCLKLSKIFCVCSLVFLVSALADVSPSAMANAFCVALSNFCCVCAVFTVLCLPYLMFPVSVVNVSSAVKSALFLCLLYHLFSVVLHMSAAFCVHFLMPFPQTKLEGYHTAQRAGIPVWKTLLGKSFFSYQCKFEPGIKSSMQICAFSLSLSLPLCLGLGVNLHRQGRLKVALLFTLSRIFFSQTFSFLHSPEFLEIGHQ